MFRKGEDTRIMSLTRESYSLSAREYKLLNRLNLTFLERVTLALT